MLYYPGMSFLDWIGLGPKVCAYVLIRTNPHETRFDVFAEKLARSIGLRGWVKMSQLPMYRKAELEVEGSKSKIEKFIQKLNEAPEDAKAVAAEVQWKTYKNQYQGFRIRR